MCATLNELMKLFAQNEYLKLKPLCHEMADGFCLSPSPDKQKNNSSALSASRAKRAVRKQFAFNGYNQFN